VNSERVRALRYAREVADDLHWRGMAVPPVYVSMAGEFRALVRSGEYAAWLAGRDSDRGDAHRRAARGDRHRRRRWSLEMTWNPHETGRVATP
jgi:hypothetical protein